jgi:hypothetical protein
MAGKKRFNSVLSGLVPGLILPAIALAIFWRVRFGGGLNEFLVDTQRMGILSKVLSLAAIPNLLLFFLFIWTNRTFSARGVIFATLIVSCVVVILRFT